jgi:RNA polymerase primary sigma factor
MQIKKSITLNTEEFQQYIKDLKKIPVISHKRQEEIFLKLNKKNIDKTEREELLNELVIGNLRFVISVAKMYQNQGLDILDLISEGNIGLIKASKRYDPTSGFKFISYAVWWIKQSIIASLNEYSRTIRIPSNLIQESQKQKKGNDKSEENDFFIKPEDESNETNLPYCVGLNSEINEDGDQLIDIIPNRNADNPENSLNTKDEIKKKVSLMLSVLDEREKIIIEKYYGLTGVESNLDDLGEEFGCTKERIRQLRDKAIKKLRNESFTLLKYL